MPTRRSAVAALISAGVGAPAAAAGATGVWAKSASDALRGCQTVDIKYSFNGEEMSDTSGYVRYIRSALAEAGIAYKAGLIFPRLQFNLTTREAKFVVYQGQRVYAYRAELFFQQIVQYDSNKLFSAATTYMLQDFGSTIESEANDAYYNRLTSFMNTFTQDWRSVNV